MPRHGTSRVAHRAGGGDPRDTLRPCDLYPPARSWATGTAEPSSALWAALSHCRADAPGYCWRPEASRGRDRRPRRAAHLGSTTPPSSPSALCPARGRPGTRRDPVDPVSAALLPARPCPLATLSATVPGGAGVPLWSRPADLDGSLSEACRACPLATVAS